MAGIGTWNLENLFRPGAGAAPAAVDAHSAKLDALATLIIQMAPDVLGVQEVGDPEALTDLADRIGGTWHTRTGAPDGRGIRVGFLSRTDLTDVVQVTDFPEGLRPIQVDDSANSVGAMGRPALSAHVSLDGGLEVDIVVCHLKSKLLTFPAAGSRPGMRVNGPASAPTPCTGAPPKPSPSALTRRPWPGPHDSRRGRSQRRTRSRHHADPPGTTRIRDRHQRLRPPRPG